MKAFSPSNPSAFLMTRVFGLLTAITLALLPFSSLTCQAATVDANPANSAAAKTQNVSITLKEYSITSSLTTFVQGVSYNFTITNEGKLTHDFTIAPPTGNADISTAQSGSGALVSLKNIHPHETTKTRCIFKNPAQRGKQEFASHRQRDYQNGMETPIQVIPEANAN